MCATVWRDKRKMDTIRGTECFKIKSLVGQTTKTAIVVAAVRKGTATTSRAAPVEPPS